MSGRNETVGRIVARAWSDQDFRQGLLGDTRSALMELGFAMPDGKSVTTVENSRTMTYLVIPSLRYTETKSAYADIKSYGETYGDPRLVPLEWASRDPVLVERLIAAPKAMLGKLGVEVANAMSVEIVQNTATNIYLVLPALPAEEDLSSDDMRKVSEGWIPSAIRYAGLERPVRYQQFFST